MKKLLLSFLLILILFSNAYGATSSDVGGEYLRVDVFNAKMDSFMSEIRLMNSELRRDMDERFNALDKKIDNVQVTLDRKIDNVQATLDKKIDERFSTLDKKIDDVRTTLDKKIDNVQATLDKKIDERFSTLDKKIDNVQETLNKKIDNVQTTLDKKIDERFSILDKKIDNVNSELREEIQGVRTEIKVIATRIGGLEHTVYWGLAALGIVLAIIGLIVAFAIFAPSLSDFIKRLRKPLLTLEDVENLFNSRIERLIDSKLQGLQATKK